MFDGGSASVGSVVRKCFTWPSTLSASDVTLFAALSREDRITVSKQAAILRVADALDRSHTQRIKDPEFSRDESGFVITVRNVDDVTLERLALEEKAGMFEAVYGTPVVLRTVQAPEGTV